MKFAQLFVVNSICLGLAFTMHCLDKGQSIYEQAWVKIRVKQIMQTMTLDDKINQTFMLPLPATPDSASLSYCLKNNIGGFCLIAAPFTPDGRFTTVEARKKQIDLAHSLINHNIPLFYATDNVHGAAFGRDSITFPHNYAYSTIARDQIEKYAELEGAWTAYDSLRSGINMIYGPAVIEAYNKCFGRVYESPGTDADKVYKFGKAFVRGAQAIEEIQGKKYITGVVTTLKHFVADGQAQLTDAVLSPSDGVAIEFGFASINLGGFAELKLLLENNAAGFKGGIESESGSVMMSYSGIQSNSIANSYTAPQHQWCSLSKDIVDLVRRSPENINPASSSNLQFSVGLGHKGFIMSDWESPSIAAVSDGNIFLSELIESTYSFNAYALGIGMDMLLLGNFDVSDYSYYDGLREYIKTHVEESRIDDAVEHILSVKVVAGLFDDLPRLKKPGSLDSEAELAYSLAFDSLTYTTNMNQAQESNVLGVFNAFPLPDGPIIDSKNKTVLLLGREQDPHPDAFGNYRWNAFYNDLGIPMGGWSFFYDNKNAGPCGNQTIQCKAIPYTQQAANINDLYENLRTTAIRRMPDGSSIKAASTILDGFNNAGIKSFSINSSAQIVGFDPQKSIAVVVLAEFPYQEAAGEIDGLMGNKGVNQNKTFNIVVTKNDTFYQEGGIKITLPTYENMKAAHAAGIPIIVIVIGGRDWTSWNYNQPMNRLDKDSFGKKSIAQVSRAIVYSLLPGTSGGDAIVQFLYNTPYKQGKSTAWRYVSQPHAFAFPAGVNEAERSTFSAQTKRAAHEQLKEAFKKRRVN